MLTQNPTEIECQQCRAVRAVFADDPEPLQWQGNSYASDLGGKMALLGIVLVASGIGLILKAFA
jgi:hypothetical protein